MAKTPKVYNFTYRVRCKECGYIFQIQADAPQFSDLAPEQRACLKCESTEVYVDPKLDGIKVELPTTIVTCVGYRSKNDR